MRGRYKEWEIYLRSYDRMYNKEGLTDELADGYVKLVNLLMFEEKKIDTALELSARVKGYINDFIKEKTGGDFWALEAYCQKNNTSYHLINRMYELWLLESFYMFESFIFYLERYREQSKRFYLPRMNPLKTVMWDLEDLAYRAIKFLGISLPSRTGKSTLSLYFLCWLAMKFPNLSSAIGSHSGILAKGFYTEVMNIITTSDYAFEDMYKFWHRTDGVIEDKSSEYLYINLGDASRFGTLVFRGIDGTWTGAIDVSEILVVDDLIRDREHSLSPTRCENTWQEYLNKMVDRKSGKKIPDAEQEQIQLIYNIIRKIRGQEPLELIPFPGALELMIGTLWNVYDPLCRMENLNGEDPLYRFRKIPALNEKDETNFPYQYTTEYLHEMREKLDAPEWFAKWMQAPYVREGLLYQPNELLYFNGECPEGKTIAVLDPAVGGGDNLSMTIIRIVGKKKYVIDWLYTNETKGKTIPAICSKIIFHNITELHYERNGIGRAFEEDVTKELHLRNYYRCKSIPFNAPEGMSKEEKILGYSDWVKSNLYFIAEEAKSTTYSRSTDYTRALNDMFIYTTVGKNKHDDSVDNLAQVARVFEKQSNGAIDVILNPFR